MSAKASEIQIGGTHYKYPLQPFEFSVMNPCITGVEFSVIRYLMRAHKKNGIEDLKKAKHCVECILEWLGEYPFLRKGRVLEQAAKFMRQFHDIPPLNHGALASFLISIEEGHSEVNLNDCINIIDAAIELYPKEQA